MDQFPVLGVPDTGDTAWMLASSALVLLMTDQAILAQMNGFPASIDPLGHSTDEGELSALHDMSYGLEDMAGLYASCGNFVQHGLE